MGMGTYACHADIVAIDFVREVCPNELEEFLETLSKVDASFDDFCACQVIEAEIDHIDEIEQELVDAVYDALCLEFNKQTDLTLEVVYNFAEDRGDDLDGGSFAVDGVYQLTPAGEKFNKHIERKTWTVFG